MKYIVLFKCITILLSSEVGIMPSKGWDLSVLFMVHMNMYNQIRIYKVS